MDTDLSWVVFGIRYRFYIFDKASLDLGVRIMSELDIFFCPNVNYSCCDEFSAVPWLASLIRSKLCDFESYRPYWTVCTGRYADCSLLSGPLDIVPY